MRLKLRAQILSSRVNIVHAALWAIFVGVLFVALIMTDWSRFERSSGQSGNKAVRIRKVYIRQYVPVYIKRDKER